MLNIITWINNLMNKQSFGGTMKPIRKKHIHLTKEDVKRVEEHIIAYNKETVMNYFNISQEVYRRIKVGKHKHSSQEYIHSISKSSEA